MNRPTRKLALHTTVILALALPQSPFAEVGAEEPDLSKLPPTPAEMHKAASASKVSLSQAIETAQKATNGLATAASFVAGKGIEVKVHTTKTTFRVTVDAASGAVTAKEAVPGLPGAPPVGKLVETSSGLKYYELKVGTGAQPAGPTTKVKVHYTGWLVNGKKFDSSVDRGRPIDFPLNGVIKGWTEGVGSMKVGGKRKLIIPFGLAYGAGGRPPVIPAKAMLVFDVELIDIVQ